MRVIRVFNIIGLSAASLILILLLGCATPDTIAPVGTKSEIAAEKKLQRELVVEQIQKEEAHLYGLAYDLMTTPESLEICPTLSYATGMRAWTKKSLSFEDQDLATDSFDLSNRPRVYLVVEGSAADRAGIKQGDVIMAVNGVDIADKRSAAKKVDKLFQKADDQVMDVTISRNGQEINTSITRDPICNYGVVYKSDDSQINAFADGERIYFTRGMYRFTDTDEERALVIAHEIAHNAMKHSDKLAQNVAAGQLLGMGLEFLVFGETFTSDIPYGGALLGRQVYSVAFEAEADYVGMYLYAAAGYDTSNVANFWRRMAAENDPGAISRKSSHPTSPERFVAITKTHKEIEAKKRANLPLKPRFKR